MSRAQEEVKRDLETLQAVITDIFKCGVCFGMLRETVMCPSGHPFCKPCLERWLGGHSTCPACRRGMRAANMVPGRFIDDFLSEALVRCPNGGTCTSKCTWQGPHSRLKDHDSVCDKKKIKCVACEETHLRKDMAQHMDICGEVDIECRDCGNTTKRSGLEDHVDNRCPKRRIQCPLLCGRECTRRQMGHHILTECRRRWEECHIPGCGAVTQDQLEHERQEVTTHNFLLRQVGARGDGEHMVHGPLHSLQWAVADPTRPVRSPTFITSGNRTWEAMAVPPSRGVPWCVCLRLVAGPPALAKIRIKMSAAEQEAVVGCTAAILPGASGKKWDLQNITNTSNIRIHILIQH